MRSAAPNGASPALIGLASATGTATGTWLPPRQSAGWYPHPGRDDRRVDPQAALWQLRSRVVARAPQARRGGHGLGRGDGWGHLPLGAKRAGEYLLGVSTRRGTIRDGFTVQALAFYISRLSPPVAG